MAISLRFTPEARDGLEELKKDKIKLKRVQKCLGLIQSDSKHPGLRTHKYCSIKTEDGGDLFQSYVENKTPAAWRVFWHWGPGESTITIVAIAPHP